MNETSRVESDADYLYAGINFDLDCGNACAGDDDWSATVLVAWVASEEACAPVIVLLS